MDPLLPFLNTIFQLKARLAQREREDSLMNSQQSLIDDNDYGQQPLQTKAPTPMKTNIQPMQANTKKLSNRTCQIEPEIVKSNQETVKSTQKVVTNPKGNEMEKNASQFRSSRMLQGFTNCLFDKIYIFAFIVSGRFPVTVTPEKVVPDEEMVEDEDKPEDQSCVLLADDDGQKDDEPEQQSVDVDMMDKTQSDVNVPAVVNNDNFPFSFNNSGSSQQQGHKGFLDMSIFSQRLFLAVNFKIYHFIKEFLTILSCNKVIKESNIYEILSFPEFITFFLKS
jgi:hypothetical protein